MPPNNLTIDPRAIEFNEQLEGVGHRNGAVDAEPGTIS